MRFVDMKSLIIGGLLVALILCLSGAVPVLDSGFNGRFQITANEGRAFIIDTATGQVWSEVVGGFANPFNDPNCAFCLPKLDIEGLL